MLKEENKHEPNGHEMDEQYADSHPHNQDNGDDDNPSLRDKRESSMLDVSNDNPYKLNIRKNCLTKRRQTKQEKAQVSALFKQLISIINQRYLSSHNLDLKQKSELQTLPLVKKQTSYISKKYKEDSEKGLSKRVQRNMKMKQKNSIIRYIDREQSDILQKKEQVLHNYQLIMDYQFNEQLYQEAKQIQLKQKQMISLKNQNISKKQKDMKRMKTQIKRKTLGFFSLGMVTILPQSTQKQAKKQNEIPKQNVQNQMLDLEQDSLHESNQFAIQ